MSFNNSQMKTLKKLLKAESGGTIYKFTFDNMISHIVSEHTRRRDKEKFKNYKNFMGFIENIPLRKCIIQVDKMEFIIKAHKNTREIGFYGKDTNNRLFSSNTSALYKSHTSVMYKRLFNISDRMFLDKNIKRICVFDNHKKYQS